MLGIAHRDDLRPAVLELEGEICRLTAPVLRSLIEREIADGVLDVALDLRGVTVFGADAVRLCVEVGRRLEEIGGSLSLQGASGLTAEVIRLTGLERRLLAPDTTPLDD